MTTIDRSEDTPDAAGAARDTRVTPRDTTRAFYVITVLLLLVMLAAIAAEYYRYGSSDTPLDPAIRININAADSPTLQLLPGIGPVLAERILADRATRGPYRDLDDLQRVKGIAYKLAERMKPHVRFE